MKKNLKNAMNYVMILSTAAIVGGCATSSKSSSTKVISPTSPEVVKKYVLDNGLVVLISPNPKLPLVSYYTLFDVGGRYEGDGTTGATHFLEHMMFKGAKKFGPGEFESIIEHNGGNSNAYTTNDATVYYENIPSQILETIIDVESDRLQHLLLEPNSFESERQVVFEERKMRYENNPDGQMYLTLMKKVFEGTPYGQSVIGEVEDLKKLSRDQMMDFFKKFYAPNNAIIGIVGDVNPEKTIEMIKKYYGPISKYKELDQIKAAKDDLKRFEFKAQFGKEYRYFATNPLPKMNFGFKALKAGEKKAYHADLLAHMLSVGESSYFHKKYVDHDQPMISGISANHYNLRFSGIFYLDLELTDVADINKVRDMILSDAKTYCEEGLSEKALQRSKNAIMTSGYHSLKSNAAVASSLINNQKYFGDFNYSQKEMKIYMQSTLNDIKEACVDIFVKQDPIVVTLWNQFSKDKKEEVINLK